MAVTITGVQGALTPAPSKATLSSNYLGSSVEFTSAKTKARSERNLKDAESYALQALSLEAHAQDAQVPYFLATEIYKPQKNWNKVIEMFDEAMKRDPEAMLLQPLMYDNKPIYKMQDQINIYYKNII